MVYVWVEAASLVAALVGLRVALESVLHSMDGPSPQVKWKIMITVKDDLSTTVAAMVEQRK